MKTQNRPCGLGIKKEYGGLDLDFNTGLLFGNSPGFSFATTIGAQTSIGSPNCLLWYKRTKREISSQNCNCRIQRPYVLTEPESGSDANSGKTKATFTGKGDYLINGQKMWITNGGFADIFIVFAKIEDDDNLSAFIVEKTLVVSHLVRKKLGIKVPLQFKFSSTIVQYLKIIYSATDKVGLKLH